MGLYENIKRVASLRGLSIASLEKECKIPNGSIRRFNKNIPSYERLVTIANRLDVAVEDLTDDMSVRSDSSGYKITITEDQIKKIVTNMVRESGPYYYTDPEAAQIAQELKDNPGIKVLFDACRKVKPEDMAKVAKMIGAFTEE